jgi:hypothetical protein
MFLLQQQDSGHEKEDKGSIHTQRKTKIEAKLKLFLTPSTEMPGDAI